MVLPHLLASLLAALLLTGACQPTLRGPSSDQQGGAHTTAVADPSQPSATPLPLSDLFARALARRAVGNDDGAAADFRAVLDVYPDTDEAARARYYLAESFARRGNWSSAVAAFQVFLDSAPPNDYVPLALFWLARSHEETGDWASAVRAYERYRTFDTPLEPYAAMRQAALQRELGQADAAAQNFTHAATSDVQPGERAGSYEKAIALRLQMGQSDEALRLYEELLDIATLPEYRARILSEAANLAASQGQTDRAQAWLREVVDVAPFTSYAVSAVEQLLDAGAPNLSAGAAARVYFNTEYYEDALPLFDAAIGQAAPGSDEALELRRLRALTQRAMGDFGAALNAFVDIAADAPGSDHDAQARLDYIQTLGQSGEVGQAADQYYRYAQTYANNWRAPVALDRAAQLYQRLGNNEQAMQVWLELGQRYPQDDLAAPALNQAAWYFYGAGRPNEARTAWQLLASSGNAYEEARGAFWAGRIARSQQDTEQARTLFEQARTAAPNSYYGFRAAEELGITLQGVVPLGAPITEDDWSSLETWVAAWAPTPEAGVQAALNEVANSGFVRRGIALADVGMFTEALAEWNSARSEWENDPWRLMALARLAHENTVPYIGLKAGSQLEQLAPAEAPPLPLTLERLIFPDPYAPLVVGEAATQGIDPRMLYALLRQESLFNPHATSWVGARGLAQVMPSTGEGIAGNLGVADFELDDLYRPYISIRFGAFYIGQRIADMEGSIHGGLAAYNGGLGNAYRWADGSSVADADLFTEYIDYPETEGYVKRVYGFYGAYQRIYTLP